MARISHARPPWLKRPERSHRRIVEAGKGDLPSWADVGADILSHLRRVAELMDRWAEELEVEEEDRSRWRAAAFLHDALKEMDADELKIWAGDEWPDPLLHGPACAGRLRGEGVMDEEVLLAIGYHSVGHPSFTLMGDFLYLADFLEPARKDPKRRRARWRDRLPSERETVLLEVAADRLRHLVDTRTPILNTTTEFWNRLIEERIEDS